MTQRPDKVPLLSVVVPVFREEDGIVPFLQRIEPVLDQCAMAYEILFCLDPVEGDQTDGVIEREIARNPRIRLLVMSRRWGQPAATLAGLEYAKGDACVVIDVDLQDPPELIADMVAKWRDGYEVVYAQRRTRAGESWHHLLRAKWGYRIAAWMSDVDMPKDTGDYRLMDRKVVDAICDLAETHGYLRGLTPYVGFRHTAILFDRAAREGGASNYGRFFGNMRININALVAFSIFPLQIASLLGLACAAVGALLLVPGIVMTLFLNPPGWAFWLLVLMLLIGGAQLVCLGILGEYMGRTYEEARRRPKFVVDRAVNIETDAGPKEG